MYTEDLSFNYSTNAKVIKDFSAVLPWICIPILSDDFIVKTINSCDLPGFMVTSQKSNVSWESQLETKKQLEGLH